MKTLREYTRLAKEMIAGGLEDDLGYLVYGLALQDSMSSSRGLKYKDATAKQHRDLIEVYGRDAYLDVLTIGALPVDESEGPAAPPNYVTLRLGPDWSPEAHMPEGVVMWDQGLGYIYDDEKAAPPGALYLLGGRQQLFDCYLKRLHYPDRFIQVVLDRKPNPADQLTAEAERLGMSDKDKG